MAVIFGAFAVGQVSSFAPDYAEAGIAAARMFKLLDRRPEIDSYDPRGKSPVRFVVFLNFLDLFRQGKVTL